LEHFLQKHGYQGSTSAPVSDDPADRPAVKNNFQLLDKILRPGTPEYQACLAMVERQETDCVPLMEAFVRHAHTALERHFMVEGATLEELKSRFEQSKNVPSLWENMQMIDWIQKLFQDIDYMKLHSQRGTPNVIYNIIWGKSQMLRAELANLLEMWGSTRKPEKNETSPRIERADRPKSNKLKKEHRLDTFRKRFSKVENGELVRSNSDPKKLKPLQLRRDSELAKFEQFR
jgi:hypothetical protein